jgi:hypothetical protein
LSHHLSRRVPTAIAALLVLAPVVAAAALGPGLASGAGSQPTEAAASSGIRTVYIVGGRGNFRFVGPKTVVQGEELRIVNLTNPHQVGPHTFSLITPGLLPKTPRARQLCFSEGHICKAIAEWHGAIGDGPPAETLAQTGAEGWDTMGSVTQKGDSWFSGEKRGASIVQQVSATTTGVPTTLYFICAIHPWMQGSITVLPPPS